MHARARLGCAGTAGSAVARTAKTGHGCAGEPGGCHGAAHTARCGAVRLSRAGAVSVPSASPRAQRFHIVPSMVHQCFTPLTVTSHQCEHGCHSGAAIQGGLAVGHRRHGVVRVLHDGIVMLRGRAGARRRVVTVDTLPGGATPSRGGGSTAGSGCPQRGAVIGAGTSEEIGGISWRGVERLLSATGSSLNSENGLACTTPLRRRKPALDCGAQAGCRRNVCSCQSPP